jgi:predicted dehydrogenase
MTGKGRTAQASFGATVRMAVVGLGYWGPNLARNIDDLPAAELVALCDVRREALATAARRWPEAKRYSRYEDLLADAAVDAVAIATPVSTHFELAAAALAAGKHVLVEKPLAASSLEAERLIALAKERELVLMPGLTFLYSPPVLKVKELIEAGELGEIYFISTSRVNLGLHQPDVSVVWDLGPHDFSILRYWLDESPRQIAATARSCVIPGVPDVAFITLTFPSEAIAHVELAWLSPSKLRRTAIVGSRRMVVYDDTSPEPVRVFDSGASLPEPETFGEYRLTYRSGDIVSPKIDPTEPLYLELADFCAAVLGQAGPQATAEMGLEIVRLLETVDTSLKLGGIPVALDGSAQPDMAFRAGGGL